MARLAVAVAVSVLGLVFVFPAAAHAAPPVCPDGTLETEPGVALNLPMPTCTNVSQITGFTVSDPPHGTVTKGSPNVYTPDAGFHGLDQFTYTITDWINGQSNAATVRVIVDNDPKCTSISVTVPANVSSVLPDLPCSDADGDTIDRFVRDPAHGTVAFSGPNVVYTPAPGYSGPDSLVFYAEDEFYASDDATLSITVSPPPVPIAIATVQPTPVPVPKDLTAPAVALKDASKKQAVAIAVTTSENASATLTLTVDKATARKLKLSRTVGTLKAALTPGTSTLKFKLSAKAAKAFKKLKRVKLTLTAVVTDAAGNKTTKTLAVTLKQ